MIRPATSYLIENEPCYLLTELDRVPPKGAARRYRTFVVVRNDKLTEFVEDMGPTKKQKGEPCRILGGYRDPTTGRIWIEHTVAELRGIAHDLKKHKWDKLALARVDRIKNP